MFRIYLAKIRQLAFVVVSSLTGLTLMLPVSTAFAQEEYTKYKPEIIIEGLVVQRSDLDHTEFTGPDNPGRIFTPFSSSDLEDKTVGGLRGTINGNVFDQEIQFSGFFIMPMETELTKSGFNQAGTNGTNATYDDNLNPNDDINSTHSDDVFAMQVQHLTYLFGAEANLKNPLGIPGLILGVRGLYFGERLASVTFDTEAAFTSTSVHDRRDRTSTRIDNYMMGVQIGYEQMFQITDGISIGGSVKAGIFHNNIERHRTFHRDFFNPTRASETIDDELKDSQVSYLFEINPRVNINLAEGINLTAGGWFLYADKVATALPHFSSAADRDDFNLRADGDVYFWGGSLGLTFELSNLSLDNNGLTSGFSLITPKPVATPKELDDRIAQLEENTARRGQKGMSLEVYGVVNQMVMAYDDGDKRDAYIVDSVDSPTRFGLKGEGRISRGWTSGYRIEIQNDSARSVNVSQLDHLAPGNPPEIRHSYMWIRNNDLGTISLGHTGTATDNIILHDLGGAHIAASNDIRLFGGGLLVRHSDEIEQGDRALITNTALIDFLPSLDTARRSVIRYDTPTWKGLTFSAAWGEDDFWDVAVKYRLNWNDWKMVASIGYLQDLDEPTSTDLTPRDRREFKGSASIIHVPTGLFFTTAFTHREYHGERSSDNTRAFVTPANTNRPDFDYRYYSAGIRQKWTSLGDTTIYGEYAKGTDAINGRREAGFTGEVTDSEIMMLGFGIVQKINAASMDLYLGLRHFEFQAEGVDDDSVFRAEDLEDINVVYAGARIRF